MPRCSAARGTRTKPARVQETRKHNETKKRRRSSSTKIYPPAQVARRPLSGSAAPRPSFADCPGACVGRLPWCLRLVRRPTFPGTLPLSQRVVPPLRPVCRVKAGSLPSAGDFLLRTLSSRHGSQPFQPWVKSAAHSVRYCGPPGYHFVWPNLEPMDADARIAFSILFYKKKDNYISWLSNVRRPTRVSSPDSHAYRTGIAHVGRCGVRSCVPLPLRYA